MKRPTRAASENDQPHRHAQPFCVGDGVADEGACIGCAPHDPGKLDGVFGSIEQHARERDGGHEQHRTARSTGGGREAFAGGEHAIEQRKTPERHEEIIEAETEAREHRAARGAPGDEDQVYPIGGGDALEIDGAVAGGGFSLRSRMPSTAKRAQRTNACPCPAAIKAANRYLEHHASPLLRGREPSAKPSQLAMRGLKPS